MKGYKLKIWARKNKDSIKTLISATIGILVVSFPTNPILQVMFGLGSATGTKLILDSVDFYISKVQLNE